MTKMAGMVAIVTGSSCGLGRAIAKGYAREGAKAVVCARSQSPTELAGTMEETATAIRAESGEVLALACDVTDEPQVEAMVRRVLDRYRRIDVLVNNAGAMVLGQTLLEIEPARWKQVVDVNITGPYLVTRAG